MSGALLSRAADATVHCFEGGGNCNTGLPVVQADNGSLTIIMQLAFGVIGAIAVIIIIVAAMSMVSAQGDPQKVAKARQTVIFAVIGLAIAVSAEAIVTFALGKL